MNRDIAVILLRIGSVCSSNVVVDLIVNEPFPLDLLTHVTSFPIQIGSPEAACFQPGRPRTSMGSPAAYPLPLLARIERGLAGKRQKLALRHRCPPHHGRLPPRGIQNLSQPIDLAIDSRAIRIR